MSNERNPDYNAKDDAYEPTCWTRKTRFQMALILVLFVVIPILLLFLAVYFGSLSVWKRSEKCENMCRAIGEAELRSMFRKIPLPSFRYKVPLPYTKNPVPPDITPQKGNFSFPAAVELYDEKIEESNSTTSKISEDTTSKIAEKSTSTEKTAVETTTKENSVKKRFFPCPGTQYPFVAVLLENLYSDSGNDYFVRCTLAVVSKVWVLTTKQCLDNEPSQKFSIRINSDYWSKDGTIKKIEQTIFFKNFVALKINEDESNHCLKRLKISGKFPEKFNTFLWKSTSDEFLVNRRKFDKIIAVDLEKKLNCGLCKGFVSPLVDQSENYLVGFQEHGRIYDVAEMDVRDWLSQVIKV